MKSWKSRCSFCRWCRRVWCRRGPFWPAWGERYVDGLVDFRELDEELGDFVLFEDEQLYYVAEFAELVVNHVVCDL